MRGRLNHRGWRRLSALGLVVYLAVLLTSPFEHHDLTCKDGTPFHCPACASSHPGADPQPLLTLGACDLPYAGRATSRLVLHESTVLPVRSTGRSPPSL